MDSISDIDTERWTSKTRTAGQLIQLGGGHARVDAGDHFLRDNDRIYNLVEAFTQTGDSLQNGIEGHRLLFAVALDDVEGGHLSLTQYK